ncbi:MAG: gamma-glutamyltransferase family protein [Acidimicrobiia bacterium]
MGRPGPAQLSTGETTADQGIAVSPHWMASEAGVEIMNAGGSAVDAAIAVDAVLAVVAPDTCGPGGDLFALVHDPTHDTPIALNASGRGGSGVTADDLRDKGLGAIPYRSPWSITVPGCVDGWEALSARFGRLPLATVLAGAINIARSGFGVSQELAQSLDRVHTMVGDQPSATALYPNSKSPPPGSTLHRHALADVLEGIATGGRESFYAGDVGAGIEAASKGAIRADDLSRVQADWISPASLDLFGRTAWTIPPNSQGYLTLAALWIFSHLDPPTDPNDPLFQHLLVEAYRAVAWEREDTVSDPSAAKLDVAALLDASRLADRADRISRDRTTRWPMPQPSVGGTAYMTVLDGNGMGVSFIQSNFTGIGSGLSAGATGVWLHNRGAGFNLIPGHPNEYAPHKRPLHTLSPTLWTSNGSLDLLLGTRGGDQQPQYLAQFAATHFHAGMCTDDTQAVPRWNMQQTHPGMDSAVKVESRFAASTIGGMRSRGHDITVSGAYERGWGPISAIDVGGERKGSADPRISTSAALAT